jgi:hypothetical protein
MKTVIVFFADLKKREMENRHRFGTLPYALYTSQLFAKVKEPTLADSQLCICDELKK